MLRISFPVVLVTALAAQDPTVKPAEASAEKAATPLERVLTADDAGRPASLTAFMVDRIETRAIFAGQYDGLKPAQEQVVPIHARSIVGDADQGSSSVFNLDQDSAGTRINAVVDQLPHHRSRPFHHLPRCNLRGHLLGKNSDQAHSFLTPLSHATPPH